MLKATNELKDGVLFVSLEGTLEESVEFEKLITTSESNKLVVNCKGISRINSVGVKYWIEYFGKCASKKIQLTFRECSPVIVQQVNAISNFMGGGKIESIMVPFSCEACNVEFQNAFSLENLKAIQFKLPEYKCPRCQAKLSFDDMPDEYFGCFRN